MKKFATTLSFVVALFLFACSDNGGVSEKNSLVPVTLKNTLDTEVKVFYALEDRGGAYDTTVVQKRFTLQPDEARTIEFLENYWDGEFTVVFNGLLKIHDVNFKTTGTQLLLVQRADFEE